VVKRLTVNFVAGRQALKQFGRRRNVGGRFRVLSHYRIITHLSEASNRSFLSLRDSRIRLPAVRLRPRGHPKLGAMLHVFGCSYVIDAGIADARRSLLGLTWWAATALVVICCPCCFIFGIVMVGALCLRLHGVGVRMTLRTGVDAASAPAAVSVCA
jgi:hypothetical protein